MVMKRKGQVFLIATLIVVGIVFTLVRTVNQGTATDPPESFYDRADEISFETKEVIDYGVIHPGQSPEVLAQNLLSNYGAYVANENIVFVYGNPNNPAGIQAIYYSTINNANAISLGSSSISIPVNTATGVVATYDSNSKTATVTLNNVPYQFNLLDGENFYFILIKKENGEQYVAQR